MSDSKERIITCARDLFLNEGMARLSMRKVADCAGMSATALYRHFANKEALLFHVLLRGFRIFADYLQRVDEQGEPLAVLEATAEAYLQFALAERGYYALMFMSSEQMTGLGRLNLQGAEEMRHTFEVLQRRVERAIDSGLLVAGDSRQAAFGIWAFAHGQVSLFFCGRSEMDEEAFIATYRQLLVAYLRGK